MLASLSKVLDCQGDKAEDRPARVGGVELDSRETRLVGFAELAELAELAGLAPLDGLDVPAGFAGIAGSVGLGGPAGPVLGQP